MSEMSEEELPASPEYGFGGAAYARARKLKQKEMQAQAWHDANVAPVGRIFPADKDDEMAGMGDGVGELATADDLRNARVVLRAYDELVDGLRAENAVLREALVGLVNRLDEIHDDPAYKSVWTVNQIHGGRYKGPTYVEELARARAALKPAPR